MQQGPSPTANGHAQCLFGDCSRCPNNRSLIGRADSQFWPRSSRQPDSEKTVEFLTRETCAEKRMAVRDHDPAHVQIKKGSYFDTSRNTYEKLRLAAGIQCRSSLSAGKQGESGRAVGTRRIEAAVNC